MSKNDKRKYKDDAPSSHMTIWRHGMWSTDIADTDAAALQMAMRCIARTCTYKYENDHPDADAVA